MEVALSNSLNLSLDTATALPSSALYVQQAIAAAAARQT